MSGGLGIAKELFFSLFFQTSFETNGRLDIGL